MKKILSNGRFRLFLIIGLLLAFGSLTLAVFWFISSPLSAPFFSAPAPTQQDYSWSYVEIAKPAKMAAPVILSTGTSITEPTSIFEEDEVTPVPADTVTPLPTVTDEPGDMVMEILENTPAPVYADPPQAQYDEDAPVNTYSGSKYILVDISEQHMYVYDGDSLVYSF
ncbi:MAG TPA: L,D-transpeptidase, partial [Anaerolineales bacterium]|nr:L,D-transpeptidase [Anaerolineales bacterium]